MSQPWGHDIIMLFLSKSIIFHKCNQYDPMSKNNNNNYSTTTFCFLFFFFLLCVFAIIIIIIYLFEYDFVDFLSMMSLLEDTLKKMMQHFHKDLCMSMVQFGMHHLGQRRKDELKRIIDTNLLSENIVIISRLKVARPTRVPLVVERLLALLRGVEG